MQRINRIVLFVLVCLIAFPSASSYALSAIPKFIDHYNHHYNKHHKISFIGFIGEHLISKEAHDKHDKEHHHKENCPASQSYSFVQFVFDLKRQDTFEFGTSDAFPESKKTPLPNYRFSFSEYNGSIWQPPKIA